MKLRRIPPTPIRQLESPIRDIPDEMVLRSYRTSWNAARYIVEARKAGRCLGDKDFAQYADALAFAKMAAGWDGARLTDLAVNRGTA